MNDFDIARSIPLRPVAEVARLLGLGPADVGPRGPHHGKVGLDGLTEPAVRGTGKYVVVTAMTPAADTLAGSAHAIGLSQALHRAGKRAACVVRQPPLSAQLGAGVPDRGGYSQVVPYAELRTHLTGDFHAVAAAHNLLAATVDDARGGGGLRLQQVSWPRTMDLCDPALANVRVDLDGSPRDDAFEPVGDSEVMALLALATDVGDLRARLGRIVVGQREGGAVTAAELDAAGAMAALLLDAFQPNLLQTLEGTPALVHAGPSAEWGIGCPSVVADRIALASCDIAVTATAWGADVGAEKFFNVKCRASGLRPDAAVLVASLPDIKGHGDDDSLRAGLENLQKQVENVRLHGVPVVVAIEPLLCDGAEIESVHAAAEAAGAEAVVLNNVRAEGGRGGEELAHAVIAAVAEPNSFRFLYPCEASLREKIDILATKVYGAAGVHYEPAAAARLDQLENGGHGGLPICVAKTPQSLSHDPALTGRPSGFTLPVTMARVAAGAGYVCVQVGAASSRSAGAPKIAGIDVGVDGDIIGLR